MAEFPAAQVQEGRTTIMVAVASPMPLSAAEHLEYVDPRKYYSCTIQLGAKTRWREYGGGQWITPELTAENMMLPQNKRVYRHIAATHHVPQLSGREMNGLIADHNQFLAYNSERKMPEGDVGRMVLVKDIQEVAAPPSPQSNLEMMAAIVAQATKSAVEAVMQQLRSSKKSQP